MGMISDHTRTKYGRRRIYFLIASIPYGLSFFCCFALPAIENAAVLFAIATAAYLFHTTATTVYLVPYRTLTAELTDDYDARTNIVGWLMAFNIAAALVAAAFALPLIRAFGGGHAGLPDDGDHVRHGDGRLRPRLVFRDEGRPPGLSRTKSGSRWRAQ